MPTPDTIAYKSVLIMEHFESLFYRQVHFYVPVTELLAGMNIAVCFKHEHPPLIHVKVHVVAARVVEQRPLRQDCAWRRCVREGVPMKLGD
jgi:hypothetical protein